MKNRYSFIALFTAADDGISIEFPDLPGCLPCADSMDEAFQNAREALGLHLWGMEQDGESIPEPTSSSMFLCRRSAISLITVLSRKRSRFPRGLRIWRTRTA